MNPSTHTLLFAVMAVALVTAAPGNMAGLPGAEAAAPPPVGIRPTATLTGEVKLVLMNHDGEVDGFLLTDGTRVKFPPHMGYYLAAVAKPGQPVRVIGFTGLPTQFGTAVEALSVTSAATGQTVIDQPPVGYALPPYPAGAASQWLTVAGPVERFLVNPEGSVDGLILASGEQVKLPPRVGYLVANAIRQGGSITVAGPGVRAGLGTALRASQIALPSGEILAGFDKPDKKGKQKKKGW
jgi:hypothetical protein